VIIRKGRGEESDKVRVQGLEWNQVKIRNMQGRRKGRKGTM
jgi:hypothetical protein